MTSNITKIGACPDACPQLLLTAPPIPPKLRCKTANMNERNTSTLVTSRAEAAESGCNAVPALP